MQIPDRSHWGAMTHADVSRGADAGIDRRKLLKLGVWAAPVVLLATATPAAAASTGGAVTVVSGTPTRLGTSSNYLLAATFDSSYTELATLTRTTVVFSPAGGSFAPNQVGNPEIVLPANADDALRPLAVSYTHLTLPTICSV